MKKTAFAAFIAFWASAFTLLGVSLLSPDAVVAQGEDETAYSLAQVAEHHQLDDCWMAIGGRVYDFSAYIPQHPTSPRVLEPWCGREATEGMRTKGRGRDHSQYAWDLMHPYQIGSLAEEP